MDKAELAERLRKIIRANKGNEKIRLNSSWGDLANCVRCLETVAGIERLKKHYLKIKWDRHAGFMVSIYVDCCNEDNDPGMVSCEHTDLPSAVRAAVEAISNLKGGE